MVHFDLSRLVLPKKIPRLTPELLCQGRNTSGESKDLLTWLDEVFKDHDTHIYIEKQMALELGLKAHSLMRWSDSVSKKEVADLWNKIVGQLKNG